MHDGQAPHVRAPCGPRVCVVAGEASGDRHAAAVVRELRRLVPQVVVHGVGGAALRAAGVELLAESTGWGAVGVLDSLRRVPRIAWHYPRLWRALVQPPPALLLLVDFGAFNMRLARRARDLACKVLYYIPPRCWDRHAEPGDLPDLVDAIATPFPWSAERLRGGRARVEWVGHPVLDRMPMVEGSDATVTDGAPTIALLPGSRPLEVRLLLPLFAAVVRGVATCLGRAVNIQLAWAPGLPQRLVDTARALFPTAAWTDGVDLTALRHASVAVVCSGTATLEVACAKVPMVITYRLPWWQWVEYLVRKHFFPIQFAGLPNILAGRAIVPELLGWDATTEHVTRVLLRLLTDQDAAAAQRRALGEVRATVGTPGAARRTAELAAALLGEKSARRMTAAPA